MEAEVDFGEFRAVIAGIVVTLWMFVLRLSHSGKAVHIAYANQAHESFLDGHVRAFTTLGGVPTGMIRYDNLRPAVIRVLLGRDRWENERFIGLRSHYGYDSDLRKLSSGKPLTSYIAQAELCKSRLNSASYLLTGQFNM